MSDSKFRCLVFDLDDTLLDTNGKIVPMASRESCQAMIDAGLNTTVDTCLFERSKFLHSNPRGNVYAHLARTLGLKTGIASETVELAGFNAFYGRKIGNEAQLFSGVRELLTQLKTNYKLYLVTQGSDATQRQKVEVVQIAPFFSKIYFIDIVSVNSGMKDKGSAFRAIQAEENLSSSQFLSIGNRVDTDLAPAKSLGWKTCWVRAGEYAHLEPQSEFEKPDFVISKIEELSNRCQL